MSRLIACMGGWCSLRESCANFAAGDEDRDPVERLCAPRKDGQCDEHRIVVQRSSSSWPSRSLQIERTTLEAAWQ